jgi:hypothetical protein
MWGPQVGACAQLANSKCKQLDHCSVLGRVTYTFVLRSSPAAGPRELSAVLARCDIQVTLQQGARRPYGALINVKIHL